MKIEPLPIILLLLFIPLFTSKQVVEEYQEPIIEAYHMPLVIKHTVLADKIIEVNGEFDSDLYILADKIIRCESGWDYTAQNNSSSAYGLGQFINSSWDYVQKLSGKQLNRYDYNDQLYATVFLLNEESWVHWKSSKQCWDVDNEY